MTRLYSVSNRSRDDSPSSSGGASVLVGVNAKGALLAAVAAGSFGISNTTSATTTATPVRAKGSSEGRAGGAAPAAGAPRAPDAAPHAAQNFAPGASGAPQAPQGRPAMAVPHEGQNRPLADLPQDGQDGEESGDMTWLLLNVSLGQYSVFGRFTKPSELVGIRHLPGVSRSAAADPQGACPPPACHQSRCA